MRIKRKFIDGTVDVELLKDTDTLLLNQINYPSGPRGFQVKAIPSDTVVYWSFSRIKVNNYIKRIADRYGFKIEFSEGLTGKHLSYNFRHSPNEYLFGAVIYVVFGAVLAFSKNPDTLFTVFLFLTAAFCLWQNINSRKSYNKAFQRASR